MSKLSLGPLEVWAPGRVFVMPTRNFKAVAEIGDHDRPFEVRVAYAHLFAEAPGMLGEIKAYLDYRAGVNHCADDIAANMKAIVARIESQS